MVRLIPWRLSVHQPPASATGPATSEAAQAEAGGLSVSCPTTQQGAPSTGQQIGGSAEADLCERYVSDSSDKWYDKRLVIPLALFVLGSLFLAASQVDSSVEPLQLTFKFLPKLGEAFLVTSVIAGFVEPRLRRQLVNEIADRTARLTALVFFRDFLAGDSLPKEYFAGMMKLARTDRISLGALWRVTLEFNDNRSHVKVTSSIRNLIKNVHGRELELTKPWLMQVSGMSDSYFTRYELGRISPGDEKTRRADQVTRWIYDRKSSLTTIRDNYGIRLDVSALTECKVAAGEQLDLTLEGVTFHATSSMIPLTCTFTTLGQDLIIEGDALGDLDITVRLGATPLSPEVHQIDGLLSHRYRSEDLALRGTVLLVQWRPKGNAKRTSDTSGSQALANSDPGGRTPPSTPRPRPPSPTETTTPESCA